MMGHTLNALPNMCNLLSPISDQPKLHFLNCCETISQCQVSQRRKERIFCLSAAFSCPIHFAGDHWGKRAHYLTASFIYWMQKQVSKVTGLDDICRSLLGTSEENHGESNFINTKAQRKLKKAKNNSGCNRGDDKQCELFKTLYK